MIQNISKMVLATLFVVACSSKPKDVSTESAKEKQANPSAQVSMEAKQLAAENESQVLTEISFRKGSAELSPLSLQKLEKLLKSVQNQGEIEQIRVISWADQAYPTKEIRELSDDQKKLADQRNHSIQTYLMTKDKRIPIEAVNMAVRPSTLNNMWGSPDSRIKKSLESLGLTNVGSEAKASQAIIMVEID